MTIDVFCNAPNDHAKFSFNMTSTNLMIVMRALSPNLDFLNHEDSLHGELRQEDFLGLKTRILRFLVAQDLSADTAEYTVRRCRDLIMLMTEAEVNNSSVFFG